MQNRRLVFLAVAALLAMLAFAMVRSVIRRADTTYHYPAYSSMNNGKDGTRAYYEALLRLGFAPSRNYKPLAKLNGTQAAVFYASRQLWEVFRYSEEKELEQFEQLAAPGARILIALEPDTITEISNAKPEQPKAPKNVRVLEDNLKKRWGVEMATVERTVSAKQREFLARLNMRPVTWRFSSWTAEWTPSQLRKGSPLLLKRAFGKGSIVLVTDSKLFTNGELLAHPDTALLAAAPGGYRRIIFDENHLGVADTGSVVGLARAHGLAWMLLGFIVLALVYVWRSAVSFVPRWSASLASPVSGRDAHLALSHLLMQSVPSTSILRVAGEEWNRTTALQARAALRPLSKEELSRLDHVPPAEAAAEYRALAAQFSQRHAL